MFYLKHVHPSHSSGEYILVQTIQVSTPFFRWNQLHIDLVSCYMLHVTCYMWSVMCCMWLVTCKSFIMYGETGDQELCSWFFTASHNSAHWFVCWQKNKKSNFELGLWEGVLPDPYLISDMANWLSASENVIFYPHEASKLCLIWKILQKCHFLTKERACPPRRGLEGEPRSGSNF